MQRMFQNTKKLIVTCQVSVLLVTGTLLSFPAPASAFVVNEKLKDQAEGAAFVAGGTAAGAGFVATVGGMGLVGGFGGVAVGMAPVTAAGAVVGSAAYGAKKAIEERDASALGAVAGGAAVGAGVSAVVGGMGLAVGGTAVAIGMAPVVAAGAVVGLAGYGLKKFLD